MLNINDFNGKNRSEMVDRITSKKKESLKESASVAPIKDDLKRIISNREFLDEMRKIENTTGNSLDEDTAKKEFLNKIEIDVLSEGVLFEGLKNSKTGMLNEAIKPIESTDPQYGIPEEKKYPLYDEAHIRSAIRLFGHVDEGHEEELANAIIRQAKVICPWVLKTVGKTNRLYKYLPEDKKKENTVSMDSEGNKSIIKEDFKDIKDMSEDDCRKEIEELRGKIKDLGDSWQADVQVPVLKDRIRDLQGHLGECGPECLELAEDFIEEYFDSLNEDFEDLNESHQYTKYVKGHIRNLKTGYRWLRKYMPDLFPKGFFDKGNRAIRKAIRKHDKSKWGKDEYKAYDKYDAYRHGLKSKDDPEYSEVKANFDRAWNHHQKSNPHHWQYWIITYGDGSNKVLDMPYENIIEMICDWWTFSWKEGKLDSIFDWYAKNKNDMILSSKTRSTVESILGKMKVRIKALEKEEETLKEEWKNLRPYEKMSTSEINDFKQSGKIFTLDGKRHVFDSTGHAIPVDREELKESVLDPVQKERCREIFDDNDIMLPNVKKQIVDTFMEWKNGLEEKFTIDAIYLIGSSSGFQYTNNSDIDITIVSNDYTDEIWEKIKETMPNGNNLEGTEHPINYFIRPDFDDKAAENVYDILNAKWLKKIDKVVIDVHTPYITEMARFFMNAFDLSLKEYERDKQDYLQLKELDPKKVEISESEKSDALSKKLVELRADLDSLRMGNHVLRAFLHEAYEKDDGIFEIHIDIKSDKADPRWSPNNLVYKLLERYGYREKIDNTIKDAEEFLENEANLILTENTDILNNLRSDLQGELKAIKDYEKHAEEAKKAGFEDIANVLADIGKEEKVHCGELQAALDKHDNEHKNAIEDGKKEASEELHEAHRDDPEVIKLIKEIKDDLQRLEDLGINTAHLEEGRGSAADPEDEPACWLTYPDGTKVKYDGMPDTRKKLLDEWHKKHPNYKTETLTEAVTFVDNAGNVKTMTAEDYNKDMHEYHIKTQIKPFVKKKVKKYDLLSEDLSNLFDEVKNKD